MRYLMSMSHVTNFIYSCLHCDSLFIRSVVLYGMHVSRTNSPIGRNSTFCSLRYDNSIDNLFDTKLSSHYCFARFQSALSIDLLARANALREIILLVVREGIFALSNANHSSINDLSYIIESLAVDLN